MSDTTTTSGSAPGSVPEVEATRDEARKDTYVLDATIDDGEGIHCFIPVEFDDDGEPKFIVGLNYISTDPPNRGHLIGVIHADGQEACDAWCEANAAEVERLFSAVSR